MRFGDTTESFTATLSETGEFLVMKTISFPLKHSHSAQSCLLYQGCVPKISGIRKESYACPTTLVTSRIEQIVLFLYV